MNEMEEEDLISEILSSFGFCGCGMPEEAIEFIRAGLQHIHDLESKVWENVITYDQWVEEGKKIFSNQGAEYFFYYWADTEGLTEHGGSVPGWLDDKGEKLLARLNEILAT